VADPKHLEIARAGKGVWNAWRLAHPSDCADFSGTDFRSAENCDIVCSGFHLGDSADFSNATFGDTPTWYSIHGYNPHLGSPAGAALFHGAVFGTDTNFRSAWFGAGARFDGAVFGKSTSFVDAVFAGPSDFTSAVFGSATFYGARFGNGTSFAGVLFVDDSSFDEAVFGENAQFGGASFGRVSFPCSTFGHEPVFDNAVFSALVQFNHAAFGDGARFRGAAFEGPACFDWAEFGDCASFEARDPRAFNEAAKTGAASLPESYRELYLDRARAADPTKFQEISFCGARFGSQDFRRYAGERVILMILRWPRRLLQWERLPRGPGSPGASFDGRTLPRFCDFSRARFDQPPSFDDVRQADNLDLAGAVFSFRAPTWPRWRYWTTETATATRLRRLRKLASEIHARDAERDFFVLERMAERGIAWSAWRDQVLRQWDFHRRIRVAAVERTRRPRWRRGLAWLRRAATSAWFALRGAGHPAVLTALTFCYRFLSDFGRSVVLPTFWLVVSLFAFGFWYGTYVTGGLSSKTAKVLATFTLANAFPFLNVSRQAFEGSAAALFPSVPESLHAIVLVHGLVSAVLLFLIILALRNHFQIR
jgi:uncharacterized protein YjbI with pentapeptide repeats